MNIAPPTFLWGVPLSGFCFQDLEDVYVRAEGLGLPTTGPAPVQIRRPGRYLVAGSGSSGEIRTTKPLEEAPALVRSFAELPMPLEEDTVLAFANEHGWLGSRRHLLELTDPFGRLLMPVPVESIAEWEVAVRALRSCIAAWDAVRAGDEQTLAALVRRVWSAADQSAPWWVDIGLDDKDPSGAPDPFVQALRQGWQPITAAEHSAAAALGWTTYAPSSPEVGPHAVRPDDLAGLAMAHVQTRTNRYLLEEVTVDLRVAADGRGQVGEVPKSLLGALWLQFALGIDRGRDYRRCNVCGNWFAVAPDSEYSPSASSGIGRTNRRYCSDSCRTTAYRRRKIEARRLHATGLDLDTIAVELGSTPDTVAKWIAGGER